MADKDEMFINADLLSLVSQWLSSSNSHIYGFKSCLSLWCENSGRPLRIILLKLKKKSLSSGVFSFFFALLKCNLLNKRFNRQQHFVFQPQRTSEAVIRTLLTPKRSQSGNISFLLGRFLWASSLLRFSVSQTAQLCLGLRLKAWGSGEQTHQWSHLTCHVLEVPPPMLHAKDRI